MDDKHRKLIMDNIEPLIKHTHFEELSQKCIENGVLLPIMLDKVKGKAFPERELFVAITKRGPNAFKKLLDIFCNLEYETALAILLDSQQPMERDQQPIIQEPVWKNNSNPIANGNVNVNDNNENESSITIKDEKLQLKEYTDEISSENKYEVKKSNKIMKHDKTETYDMKTKNNRGVLFMVNIINFEYAAEKDRNGAKNDTDAMLYLFKELGFKLFSYTNLTKQQFFVLLEELLKSEHTKNTECFVMALASHGGLENNEQCVVFADGEIAEEREIEAKFAENACNNLKKRPKIFIFPFCRGNMSERGTDSINGNVIERPVLSDLIVCFATSKGYVAYRDDFGTFYIQLFVENMSDNAHDTMFEDIVKKIQTAMKNKCAAEGKAQTPNYENRDFSKALYFNPGYWEGKDESDE